jgi:mono/diheme cytochrome c family protein
MAAAILRAETLPPPAAGPIDFETQIRPLFEARCVKCHGPEKQKGGWRADLKAEALTAGDNYAPNIHPGKSAESPLIRFVAGLEPDMKMPAKGDPLTPAEIGLLRAWIDQGALWPEAKPEVSALDWWSLQPLKRPAVPGSGNPLDVFIGAKLGEQHLAGSPEADRRTLIRRATFDLIGLPPKPEEVAAFIDDADPRAYEKLIDRLLASPQYGERWARHWLDVVRYGETHGYDKDQPRHHSWPYRDYVIRAFNEDKPYARFVQEQLAGDALFPGTRDGIEALGFIAAGPWDLIGHMEVPESKTDGKIARNLDRDDMVSNAMNTFASVTVQCARCHNHKFDKFITQQEYYGLQSIFSALDRADKPYDLDPALGLKRADLSSRRKEITTERDAWRTAAETAAGAPLAELKKQLAVLTKPQPGKSSKAEAYGYHSAISPQQDVPKWVQVDLGSAIAIGKVVMHPCKDDFNKIGEGFGFPVRFKVELSSDPAFAKEVTAIADETAADFANPRVQLVSYNGNGQSARYVRVTATKLAPRKEDFIFALGELEVLDVTGKNLANAAAVSALDSIEAPPRWRKTNLTDGYYAGADLPGGPEERQRLEQQIADSTVRAMPPQTRRDYEAAQTEIQRLEAELNKLPAPHFVYAGTVHSGAGAFAGTGGNGGRPRPIFLLHRGDVNSPREPALPGALPIFVGEPAQFDLPAEAPEGQRRAALAKWLTQERNPLTWRSIVNRVWQYHFGRGLVETANDFGKMGRLPSHPELLDWLAVEFRDGGQSLKGLHRLIMTSATYRQASGANPAAEAIDADNRLLWRANRRKLEAEAVRDSVLAVSGKLDLTMGGPSFQDFVIDQPAHSPHYEYKLHDPADPKAQRRSIYRWIVRSQPQPFLTTLDCADPSMSVEKRNESVSALQALALMNNALMLRGAQDLAARLEHESNTLEAQLARGYQLAFSRSPSAPEATAVAGYAREHGLANACRVILNLNEFVFVD